MIAFIDQHKDEYGVEPICKQLPIAPSTYYAAKARPESKRTVSDAVTTEKIKVVHKENYGVYGARKSLCRPEPCRPQGRPVHGGKAHAPGRAARCEAGQGASYDRAWALV